MKFLWKHLSTRIWMIVTVLLCVLLVVVNVLASTQFFNIISIPLGGNRIVLTGENESRFSYIPGADNKDSALRHGNEVSITVCEEGYVLLKNEEIRSGERALPLPEKAKVSIFGKNSVDMVISGTGSGGGSSDDVKTIFDSLTEAGFEYNRTLRSFYESAASGDGRSESPSDLDSGAPVGMSNLVTGETPQASYTQEVRDSYAEYSDAALIVITRIGGEGFDMPRADDGSHFLQLDANEQALVDAVTDGPFERVILLLNTPSTLEMGAVEADDGVDGILWMGYSGAYGVMALGELLRGETADGTPISPSGRTVDTWAADFTHNPTWNNFGGAIDQIEGVSGDAYITISNRGRVRDTGQHFVDYEEGIYIGYRYYETAYAEAQAGNYPGFDYDTEVVYPFGYGLSYSQFSWTLDNAEDLEDAVMGRDTELTFRVTVRNDGDVPARDVVQLYVTPPYTAGGIEKSAKVLVGFAKTEAIAPGETETVEITVDPYMFASYDYNDANENGFKGYELEAGEYTFALSTDAHTPVIETSATIGDGIVYDEQTEEFAQNLYTDNADGTQNSDTELGSVLSRADFTGTWPQARPQEERLPEDAFLDRLESLESNPNNPNTYTEMPTQNYSEEPVYDEEGNLVSGPVEFDELIDANYDDPRWEEFMDRLSAQEMLSLINQGAFQTVAISRLGIPKTTSADGPVGFCNFMGDTSVYDTCVYPCEVTLASTWNIDRLYDMGESVGNEGLVGNVAGDGAPYTGWYAPGLNLHRSPFGGRNFEYYSEDSFLSGQMAAAVTRGTASKGVYTCLKHFAVNEQETHRAGTATWLTEQSMREVYLKAFEIAVKDGNARGVMSSFNRIGERWTGGDYRLLTTILRDEWGFRGLVICDFNTHSHMNVRDMVYAGGDLNLESAGFRVWSDANFSDPNDVTVIRQAAKNILYVIVNSNAMRGDFMIMPPVWQTAMFVIDGVIAAGLIAWGVTVIVLAKKRDRAAGAV